MGAKFCQKLSTYCYDFSSLVHVMYYIDFQLLSQQSIHGINATWPVLNFDEVQFIHFSFCGKLYG